MSDRSDARRGPSRSTTIVAAGRGGRSPPAAVAALEEESTAGGEDIARGADGGKFDTRPRRASERSDTTGPRAPTFRQRLG